MKHTRIFRKLAEALEDEAEEVASSCRGDKDGDCAEEQEIADRLRRAAAALRGGESADARTATVTAPDDKPSDVATPEADAGRAKSS